MHDSSSSILYSIWEVEMIEELVVVLILGLMVYGLVGNHGSPGDDQ